MSAEVVLAALRVHLLRGDEEAGPEGFEPNPWAPVSPANEAAAQAMLAVGTVHASLKVSFNAFEPTRLQPVLTRGRIVAGDTDTWLYRSGRYYHVVVSQQGPDVLGNFCRALAGGRG